MSLDSPDDAGPGGAVGRYLHDHLTEMLDRLSAWVAIPSVSADVRHAKPDEWSVTAPFTPVERGGRLYGRGASDAKGQALAHI